MYFPFYIAQRYLRTASKNNAINIISRIASVGIVIGSMSLFVVLSVFSGLKEFSLSFSNNFDPDLKIFPKKGKTITISSLQLDELKKLNEIKFYSNVIEEKVLFVYKGKEQVAEIKGVDNQFNQVNKIQKAIYQGQWLIPETPQVVIGNGIASKLSLGLFDLNNTLQIYAPRPGKGSITNPETAFNKSNLIPIGIYSINDDLDTKYVFTDLQLTQDLLEYKKNQVSAIEIKMDTLANEGVLTSKLSKIFNHQIVIKNRTQLNDSLHKMLNTENTAIYLIFTLVIIMTLFTLAGAIIMMILEKKSNLKTLLNLGTTIQNIQLIFLLQGTLITFLGGIIGITTGFILVFIQDQVSLIKITESLPYPVKIESENILIVFGTITILGFMASLIAGSRVTKKLLNNNL
ncbi:ABC transporter permease [Flavobacterium davisii]|uniref:ABC transporter permease n=1 Tax=Flavobacterium davisii TaxID=2906077 RepID=A0A246GNH4_9FLAO|nr:ABC transporter permease [Flavobacterium davisii]OWP85298.1 ABC transporter permease [Flavobacterium davisii]